MRTHLTAALTAAALLTLAACSTEADAPATDKAKAAPSSSEPSLSAADRAKAREAAGLPPEPDAVTRAAYLADLEALGTDIVHGKSEKAVSRGLSQCQSIKSNPDDRAELIRLTNYRFTSPDHPNGHGSTKAELILGIVHKHLCPDF